MVKPIEYADANAEVRAVFDEIMAARGVQDVNNFWKYLAHDPVELRSVWDTLCDVMADGALSPEVKELIYVAVSIANGCDYCVASHSAVAAAKGATPDMLNEMRRIVAMASRTNALAVGLRVPVDPQFEG
ncbi:MAG: carboxymuconolactone decarboxylase family protein [Minwuia sp.]|nr:carboxymuconolactone decarboxylase family protein [Minwuia sp.]